MWCSWVLNREWIAFLLCTLLKLTCMATLLACLITLLACTRLLRFPTSWLTRTQVCIANALRVLTACYEFTRKFFTCYSCSRKYPIGLFTKLWVPNSVRIVWLLPTFYVQCSIPIQGRRTAESPISMNTWHKINPATENNRSDTAAY